ncbi:diacylglycerol cholinephosphotransferase NDAI_0F02920 [Naumovozyma dairenensis CBS 421]|uniref:diacylglycerol cholinephosphotransferase n=1 Tax=Naumovozyma dairenensis (strain ATCC 10597 / BCRC 20456 / CBS 421 / NBRC 0211 / NRRL Y-12639) TaxID=1071378 RepID=G0WCU9_NAUDC|nr:hypothetical protein NDAI_0F02920 [Naumovozyma dairenensis CBS 421]CCD25610.1 hypothetical protein NDAI_0F02920 [Naumovozyma dairenensis CBS 421]
MGFFISRDKLTNLKSYKYQSEDHSILSNAILKPYWRQFSKIFPVWMAPNVVTLLGLSFIIINVLATLYYDPSLTEQTPSWTYFSYAIGLFLYQTFDACDGLHARRTGQSGPLGELFDHCIDSINTTLSMLPFISTAKIGFGKLLILVQFTVLGNFYLSTWEEFHTHKLYLSEFCGPVEGIFILITSYIIVGIWGPDLMWHKVVFQNDVVRIESIHLWFTFSFFAVFYNIIAASKNVKQYYKEQELVKDGQSDSTGTGCQRKAELESQKELDIAIKGLLPFLFYFISVIVLITVNENFINLPLVLSIGLTMAFVVGRIIVAHLTNQDFPMINFPMLVPSIQLVYYLISTHYLKRDTTSTIINLVWFGLGLTLGIHAMFINEIIYEFTDYLDVYALTIKHPHAKVV